MTRSVMVPPSQIPQRCRCPIPNNDLLGHRYRYRYRLRLGLRSGKPPMDDQDITFALEPPESHDDRSLLDTGRDEPTHIHYDLTGVVPFGCHRELSPSESLNQVSPLYQREHLRGRVGFSLLLGTWTWLRNV